MILNNLKIAYRTLMKQKVFAIINVLGLAIGIACCILLMHSIRFELSFDNMHPDVDRIYKLNQRWFDGDYSTQIAAIAAPYLKKDMPEVEAYNRIISTGGSTFTYINDTSEPLIFVEDAFGFADENFFSFYGINIVKGDKNTVFSDPNAIVITQSAARRYFGDDEPLGKILRYENRHDLQVTGIMEDYPPNSSIDLDLVAPISFFEKSNGIKEYTSWWWPNTFTTVKLNPEANAQELNDKMVSFASQYREGDVAEELRPRLQPFTDIRLYGAGNEGEGTIRFVTTFSVVALLILVIACFNFMNLSTARALRRAREVGVRKVIGARKGQLIAQFLTESVLITFISLLLGLLIAELLLPFFRSLSGQIIDIDYGGSWMYLSLLAILIVVGILSGSYPAFFLSRFKPVVVFKGLMHRQAGGIGLRRMLVVLQFGISIALIIGTIVVYRQVSFMQEKTLGYSTDQILQISTRGEARVSEKYESFKNELLSQTSVEGVTASNWMPGAYQVSNIPTEINGQGVSDPGVLYVDFDFPEVMGFKVLSGRGFSEDIATDGKQAFLINETASGLINDRDPLQSDVRISYGEYGKVLFEKKGEVIGVVNDFHAKNLRMSTGPVVITIEPSFAETRQLNQMGHVYVRFRDGALSEGMQTVESLWYNYFPDRLFEAELVDQRMARIYQEETTFGKTIGFFSLLAILVTSLGLLGLSAYVTERRSKEIGVRKVLGASLRDLVLLLTREFTFLALAGFVLAAPLAWYLMDNWLVDFPYRIQVSIWIILAGGLLSLLLAWATVGYQSVKAALLDPVNTLKDE
ncbi:ABC transporter permease [Roseivirga sp. BDSF3-8]|uniref:ABC transporter permease n=1 Tax=Roseivirga sp. BDSF3-8 TaxID=3241598 RepID=UPI003531A951